MAVELSLTLEKRDEDKINLVLTGSYESTIDSTDLVVTDPDGATYNVDLTPEIVANPASLPSDEIVMTPTNIGLTTTNFKDGVWKFDLTAVYTDATPDDTYTAYILFNNNAVNDWFDLVELTACIAGSCSDYNKRRITESREYIQAASEAFRLTRFTDAKKLLNCATDVAITSQ